MTTARILTGQTVTVDDQVVGTYVVRDGKVEVDRAVEGTVRRIQQVSPTVHKLTVRDSTNLDWVLDTRHVLIEAA